VLDGFGGPILFVDKECLVVYVNDSTERFFKKNRGELVGRSIWDVLPKNVQSVLDFYYNKALSDAEPSVYDNLNLLNRRCIVNFYPARNGVTVFLQDITSKWQTEELYRLALFLLDRLNETVFLVRFDGRLFHVNDETSRLLGYTRDELIHMKIFNVDTNLTADGWQDEFNSIKVKKQAVYESKYRAKDGMRIPVEVSVNFIELYGNEYYCVAARDITYRKRVEEEIKNAKAQAELYLDLMGHDINNLNQIALGYLELANEIVKDNQVRELVKKPLEAIQNSSKLIDNVRKLQRLKNGELKIELMDLDELLAELRNQYLNAPGKDIAIDYVPGRSCFVMANGLLRDVFSNLIGNAIKHSGPSKSVWIGLELERIIEDGREYCQVTVEDNGPGIPEAQKDQVFARFKKEKTKPGGKGLGLYLVRSLVEDFHGTVRVEDRVQGDHTKGARLVVVLPAAEK